MQYILLFENYINNNSIYIAPERTVVYRAQKKGINGNYFTLDKGTEMGYIPYQGELVKKDISGKKFINEKEIQTGGFLYTKIKVQYPHLFEFDKELEYYSDYLTNIPKTEIFTAIEPLLKSEDFNGIFNDYEIYVYD